MRKSSAMVKLLVSVILCITYSRANPIVETQIFEAPKTDVSACAQRLRDTLAMVVESIIANAAQCTNDCENDIEKVLKDLWESLQDLVVDLNARVAEVSTCGDNIDCKTSVVKEIVRLIAQNIKHNDTIIEAYLEALHKKCPAVSECIQEAYSVLIRSVRFAVQEFVRCIQV